MRIAIIFAAFALLASAASAAPESACCDLYIFQPRAGQAESYAVQVRGSGRTVAAEVAIGRTPRLVPDPAARALVRTWITASHDPQSDSILIEGDAQFHMGPLAEDNDAPRDGDTLILVHSATPAKAHEFIDDIDDLPADMKAQMKAAIGARG